MKTLLIGAGYWGKNFLRLLESKNNQFDLEYIVDKQFEVDEYKCFKNIPSPQPISAIPSGCFSIGALKISIRMESIFLMCQSSMNCGFMVMVSHFFARVMYGLLGSVHFCLD